MKPKDRESPAAEKHSPAEIVKKVRKAQEQHEIPAVSSREAAKLLDYKDDYVTVKLNEMVDNEYLKGYKTGAGFIYWVPEEDDEGGEVDVSSIGSETPNIDNLDPGNVSREKAREIAETNLSEFADDNWWQREYKVGYSMMQAGGVGFGISIGILLANSALVEDLSVPQIIFQAAALLFVFGGIAISAAAILMLFTYLGQRGVEKGLLPAEPSLTTPW